MNERDREERKRSLEQNKRMWAMLTDISRQVMWPVDGEMQWLEPWEWKIIISAGLRRHQRIARGIEGGFVMLGESTRNMTMRDFSDMIELMYAFGAEHGVVWSDPTQPPPDALLEDYMEMRT